MNVNNTIKNSTLIVMILLAALTRWLPHAPNFTAIGAMALFAGAFLPNRTLAVFVPLAALFVGDLFFGMHNTMIYVYGAIVLTALLGFQMLKQNNFAKTGMMALLTSFLFFVITNFGVWLQGGMYTRDLSGLQTCYLMAIPFFRTQVLADLFYSGVLFGAWELVRRKAVVTA